MIGFDHDEAEHRDWASLFVPPYALCDVGLPLPSLPEAFTVTYEANILERDYTTVVEEAYSQEKDALRHISMRNGSTTDVLMLGSMQYRVLDHTTCTEGVDPKDRSWQRQHGKSGHLKPASELLSWGKSFGYNYTGVQRVRGVPCNSWSTTIAHHIFGMGIEYTIDWFFTLEGWKLRGAGAEGGMPMRIHLKGSMNSTRHPGYAFEHYYEFTSFHAGEPEARDMSVFEIPQVCPSRYLDGGEIFHFKLWWEAPLSESQWAREKSEVEQALAHELLVRPAQVRADKLQSRRGVGVEFIVTSKDLTPKKGSKSIKQEYPMVTQVAALAARIEALRVRVASSTQAAPALLAGRAVAQMSAVTARAESSVLEECAAVQPPPLEDYTVTQGTAGGLFFFGMLLGSCLGAIGFHVWHSCLHPTKDDEAPFAPQADHHTQPSPSDGLPGCLSTDAEPQEMGMQPLGTQEEPHLMVDRVRFQGAAPSDAPGTGIEMKM